MVSNLKNFSESCAPLPKLGGKNTMNTLVLELNIKNIMLDEHWTEQKFHEKCDKCSRPFVKKVISIYKIKNQRE